MNHVGSPFHKLLCITCMHPFVLQTQSFNAKKMPIAIMPKYGIHD